VTVIASPASAYCQRWGSGRHSFRHPSEGGFDARRFTVVPMAKPDAERFACTHHYDDTAPATRRAYALTTDDERLAADPARIDGRAVVGVALLSTPMQARVLTNVFPTLEPYYESLELGRFVLLDDVPANAESFFLGAVFRLAAADGLRGVVSFSDPLPRHRRLDDGTFATLMPGHVGLIYQATNGYACGRSERVTEWHLPRHGRVLSNRTLQKIKAGESGADGAERRLVTLGARPRRAGEPSRTWLLDALADLGAESVRHPGKYRYAWPLGNRTQRRNTVIALPRTPYPKPDADVMAPGDPMLALLPELAC
jgi:hypothetical protein